MLRCWMCGGVVGFGDIVVGFSWILLVFVIINVFCNKFFRYFYHERELTALNSNDDHYSFCGISIEMILDECQFGTVIDYINGLI